MSDDPRPHEASGDDEPDGAHRLAIATYVGGLILTLGVIVTLTGCSLRAARPSAGSASTSRCGGVSSWSRSAPWCRADGGANVRGSSE